MIWPFTKKPRCDVEPLGLVLHLVNLARYQLKALEESKTYQPNEKGLARLERITDAFYAGYSRTLDIKRALYARAGKPSPPDFNRPE
jgi:hypothetical protein